MQVGEASSGCPWSLRDYEPRSWAFLFHESIIWKISPWQKKQRQHWKLKLIGQFWMTQYLKIFVKPQGLQISTLEQVSMSSNACFVLRRPPSPGWLDDVRLIRLNLIWTGGVKHRGAMPLPPNSRRENFKMHFDGFNGWSEPTKNSSILFDCFRPSLWSMGRTHWKKWEKLLEPLQCALHLLPFTTYWGGYPKSPPSTSLKW